MLTDSQTTLADRYLHTFEVQVVLWQQLHHRCSCVSIIIGLVKSLLIKILVPPAMLTTGSSCQGRRRS